MLTALPTVNPAMVYAETDNYEVDQDSNTGSDVEFSTDIESTFSLSIPKLIVMAQREDNKYGADASVTMNYSDIRPTQQVHVTSPESFDVKRVGATDVISVTNSLTDEVFVGEITTKDVRTEPILTDKALSAGEWIGTMEFTVALEDASLAITKEAGLYDTDGKLIQTLTLDDCGTDASKVKALVNANSNVKEVILPDGVTSIGDIAFLWCEGLTSISIPNSITSIGENAFCGCTGLTSITIPNSVTSIGNGAFVNIPVKLSDFINNSSLDAATNNYWGAAIYDYKTEDGLYIRENAIVCNDNNATSVTIPNNVTSIDSNCWFGNCTSITVASGNTVYDSRDNCNAIIETSTNKLVAGCKNTTIPNNIKSIGDCAFAGFQDLESIIIPDSVTSIGIGAFEMCSNLTSVTIGSGVANIGECAFNDCGSLKDIYYNSTKANWDAISKGENWDSNTNNYTVHCEKAAGLYDTDGKLIQTLTLDDCGTDASKVRALINANSNVKEVILPDGVTSIGSYAFSNCTGLTSVTIPNSVTSIGSYAFSNCTGLTSVTIPDSVTSIGDSAFSNCTGLTSVTIPNSVTKIGRYAFNGCRNLTSVTIPNSVTSISEGAFYNVPHIYYNGSATGSPWGAKAIN